ncbi:MAG: SusD/RagB family nutrient-binding outer membrane lipoprotein [Flavisolibacter sp.]|nr:SusD/RagB family nutrient-binding outer membrane lipoprotein [Flavisolibacter sp.]
MRKLFLYSLIIAGVLVSGCKKYLNVNTDPNLVYNPPINSLLVTTTYQTGLNVQRMGNITSYYVQYLASPNAGSDRDTYKDEDLSTTWTFHYNVMTDIREMMRLAQDRQASEHMGVAKLLMALNLNMLINMFGDVPYSQAFLGKGDLTPGFDNQQALHDTTIKLVNEAITEFNKPTPTIRLDAASDLIHKGSVTAWKKTAYALKARFLNQLSKTNKYNATEILAALGNAYTSNADNATLTTFQGNSPWNQVARDNANLLLGGWLSEQFVEALNGKSFGVIDPRLSLITNLTRFNDYRGTPNGKGRTGTGTNNEESVLTTTGFYSKAGAPLFLVTYAETKFIEAEAAFRSNDKPKAYAAYLAGIRAHMDMMGVPTEARDAYINNPVVSVGANNLTLDLIFKEKYVAMFLHPEAWVDARRFNYQYKDFTLPVNAAFNEFIRRSAYPVVETSRNGANVPSVTLSTRLWWDQ